MNERLAGAIPIRSFYEASELLASKHLYTSKDYEIEIMPLNREILSVLSGLTHTDRRRMENPLFTRRNLVRLEHDALSVSLERQLAMLFGSAPEPSSVRTDLVELSQFTFLPVTAALVGLDGVDQPEWWKQLSDFVHMFSIAAALHWKEGDVEQERHRCLEAVADFDRTVFTPAFDRRLALVERVHNGNGAADSLPDDLITTLLLHLPGRQRELILRETIAFFSASADTSTMAVATTVLHLDDWCDRHPADRAHIADLGFIQRAVFEAIRLYPPPGTLRKADAEITLSSGRVIPARREIFFDFVTINRDPDVFGADATEYNPARHLPQGVRPYALGFGGGVHKCIGRPLATSHDEHSGDTKVDAAIGSVVRMVQRLLELNVRLDPDHPPVLRPGWRQKRYSSFPIVLTAESGTGIPL